ncbi:uncharacterized protein K460DRAFT_400251 [Cucurbitaria berberidis CBS 394.84]|uniref:Uncharacterized protein n=1 Tax=Cucurbitaria berberidis CBS 394.84 TaxID=1168544 RepID=A0A9P4GRQ0_9PLEO|nr:uncharacterized protein K460DRAFT_400251 [Cucurbitaria berberidis CBS 394.84]KAF1850171.1 hypothetical protein K460DRAFT_400251 [Cucurbitaria berberidis CBS 394.84]
MSNDFNKKMKGLKDHKKVQKAKQTAKRVAAAEKNKPKKATEVILDVSSTQIFDIHAHRKALESALYNNMETPNQMLARLNFAAPADAEFHQDIGVEDDIAGLEDLDGLDIDDSSSRIKCLDDNGFEIILDVLAVRTLTENEICSTPITPKTCTVETKEKEVTIDQLFTMVSSTGAKKVGTSHPTSSRTLESIETQQAVQCFRHGHTISIEQLFSVASSTNSKVIHNLSSNSSLNPKANTFVPFVTLPNGDPAIISMKVKERRDNVKESENNVTRDINSLSVYTTSDTSSNKLKRMLGIESSGNSASSSAKHSRASSYFEDRVCTPLTHHSTSPVRVGSGYIFPGIHWSCPDADLMRKLANHMGLGINMLAA